MRKAKPWSERFHIALFIAATQRLSRLGFRRIDEEIRAEQLPTLAEGLVERAAFRDIFEFAKTLEELTDERTSGLERARENAHALAHQVVEALKAIQQENNQ